MDKPIYSFKTGYELFQKASAASTAFVGDNYVGKVEEAINTLTNDMHQMARDHQNMSPAQLQGFMAEVWHSCTFNINSTVKDSSYSATVQKSTAFGSVDISVTDGSNCSLKYYKNGQESAFAQAKTYWQRYNEDLSNRRRSGLDEISFSDYLRQKNIDETDINVFDSIYHGQVRIIPSDQLEFAIDALKKKIEKESLTRPELVSGYKETLERIQDRLKASDGTESIPLSRADSDKIAQLAKEEGFDPKDFGISTEQIIGFEDIIRQSVNAGITAAVISCVLKVAPEIYKTIDILLKQGEVSKEQFNKIGFAALSGGSQGFVRGSISSALTITLKAGLLGKSFKDIDPSMIGVFTVIAMNTMSNSYKLATNKISKGEFAHEVSKDFFVTTCSIALGGFSQLLTPELPVLGYLLGSMIGSLGGSFLHDTGYSSFMSLCCDTGFTCFGLVEQDYKIPSEILIRIGMKTFDFTTFKTSKFETTKFQVSRFNVTRAEFNTIRIDFLKRNVIGIAKIAYTVTA